MKYLITLAMIIAASLMPALAQCSEADKKALEAFDKAWTDTNARGDRASMTAIYADDYAGFPNMVTKAQAIDGAMRAFENNRANPSTATTTADHYMIMCSPVSATILHRNTTVTKAASGTERTSYSRSVHVLEKRGGKWQVVGNAGHGLDDNAVLDYMERDWINAIKNRDVAWFDKNLASDFTEVSFMSGQVVNKKQWIDELKADKSVMDVMEVSELAIRVDGNNAIVTGLGHAVGKDASGKPFDMKLRFTDTFIKRDGRWQAWASQATVIPATQAVAGN
jgi:ketosteroid isomerase-like protein